VSKGQYEAGYSVGMNTLQILRRIIIPQVIPIALPPVTNDTVGILKGTSVLMTVGIMVVMTGSTLPCHATYSFLVGYVAAAIIYWAMTVCIELSARRLQASLEKSRVFLNG
jgi:L-cystine transport system permease protein